MPRLIVENRIALSGVSARNAFLGRLAALVEDGRCAGQADIAALRKAFDSLQTFQEWLAGPGKPLLKAALDKPEAAVALR